ncbi:hypothetical protein JHK85_043595 [Glycine max]|nr:hypothetical protein JHK85_043595 [Glycine max]
MLLLFSLWPAKAKEAVPYFVRKPTIFTVVETVLRGGTVKPMPELLGLDAPTPTADDASEGEVICTNKWRVRDLNPNFWFLGLRSDKGGFGGKCKRFEELAKLQIAMMDLNLWLTPSFLQKVVSFSCRQEIRWPGSPSMNSEESGITTTCLESGIRDHYAPDGDRKVLNLFI